VHILTDLDYWDKASHARPRLGGPRDRRKHPSAGSGEEPQPTGRPVMTHIYGLGHPSSCRCFGCHGSRHRPVQRGPHLQGTTRNCC